MPRSDYVFIIGFMNLSFFIDFTETFFLRSTTWNSVLMVVLLFIAGRACQAAPPGLRVAVGPASRSRRGDRGTEVSPPSSRGA